MRKFVFVATAFIGWGSFSFASAQQTHVYSYDVHGRLNASGTSPTASTTYRFDKADNRKGVTCCEAVGPAVMANGFDPYYYMLAYPDIRTAGLDPYQHWISNGSSEGRNPNRFFDAAYYRSNYGIPASVNALADYYSTGWQAGRNPSAAFSTSRYRQAHPDIAAANINPLQHYLEYGYAEGRARFSVQ